ncbi:hypothetical protein SLEP1_g34748 [Rubroshorea leprosula]|uniref:ATP synthase F0 subunit 8 n=1 Tax=Rubroshorea leprosula TaxID=152421 RepID=A0AAV5KLA5_9ROSI|nr:hypothetical protein SLEP1_g34748 [Rubroshorea leprosula]
MFDFEDDFILESSRIPWIIWIQILVLLLLMLLLYCFFSIFSLDPSTDTSRSLSASSSISHEPHFKKPVSNHNNTAAAVATDCFQQAAQGGENQSIKGDIATGTRRRVVRGEDNVEREGPSSKDASPISLHPCHYFRLAKIAFLKCLGLDPSASEQRRQT